MHATTEPIITINERGVSHNGSHYMPVDTFCRIVSDHSITGLRQEPIPDNVRWLCERGQHAVYIVELQPELRQVLWSDNKDNTTDAKTYTIATPYVILKVSFLGNAINRPVEVFYRNQPLQSLNDPLDLCNLRNASAYLHCPGYLCTSGLSYENRCSREDILSAVVNHLWTGLFSRRQGWKNDNFWRYQQYGTDQRVQTIRRWQKESLKDPQFVLGVKWLPSRKTVRDVIQYHFATVLGGLSPAACSQLGNLIHKAR